VVPTLPSENLTCDKFFNYQCATFEYRPVESNFSWSSGEGLNNVGIVEIYKHAKVCQPGGSGCNPGMK